MVEKKGKQDRGCENQDWSIRMLQAQPIKMLLSAQKISMDIEQLLERMNKNHIIYLAFGFHPLPALLSHFIFFYLNKLSCFTLFSLSVKFIFQLQDKNLV
jgi:hypothetical protein